MAHAILSDEEIEQLLQHAEFRMRENSSNAVAIASEPSNAPRVPKPFAKPSQPSYIKDDHGVARTNPQTVVDREQLKLSVGPHSMQSNIGPRKINDQLTAGSDWFDLPKTELTPQLKRDLQLIEMRSVLDPHRHYKKNIRKGKIPTFSQVGTVIEGPTEFYSARINKKDRVKNFTEEALQIEKQNGRFKRKYNEIQEAKTSGKKAHYKKLMAQRKRRS